MRQVLVARRSVTVQLATAVFAPGSGETSHLGEYNEAQQPFQPYVAYAESDIPVLSIQTLLGEWQKLKLYEQLLPHETSAQIKDEIAELCCQLNSTKFPDFSRTNLVGLDLGVFPDVNKLTNIIHEMVLAYQLSLRLDKTGWYWLNVDQSNISECVTEKVVAAVLLSRPWILNIGLRLIDGSFRLQPALLDQQMEGLLSFAELLQWPYLFEVQNYADIVQHATPQRLHSLAANPYMWDWLYGLTLPGRYFAHKIMLALVLASQSTKNLGLAPAPSFGLVLSDRSYWRQSCVLGKVMAGLKNVKAISGWIGPCPAPRNKISKAWARIKVPIISFPKSEYRGEEFESFAPDQGLLDPQPGEDPIKYLEELEDWSKQMVPVSPTPSEVGTKLLSIELEELPMTPDLVDQAGRDYKARIEFAVGGEKVAYTLKMNPTFVAAHPCVEGPHTIHSRQQPEYSNFWEVSDLKTAPEPATQKNVMVINATCGEGEVLARAWCAERGIHAVIRRESATPTCFACAVRMASNVSLGTNVLIWS
jgi:hypothetical protein